MGFQIKTISKHLFFHIKYNKNNRENYNFTGSELYEDYML